MTTTARDVCDGAVPPSNDEERRALAEAERLAGTLVNHLLAHHQADHRARGVAFAWPGRMRKGSAAFFDRRGACVLMSLAGGVERDEAMLRTRVLTTLSQAATEDPGGGTVRCQTVFAYLLDIATRELRWRVALDCEVCMQHGACSRSFCADPTVCRWRNDPLACFAQRTSWPELVGENVHRALSALRFLAPHKRVALQTLDVLGQRPGDRDSVLVTYDARTNLVTPPAPHLSSMAFVHDIGVPATATRNHMAAPSECFLPGLGGTACVGAPPFSPATWHLLIGMDIEAAVLEMKIAYPQATIAATPVTYGVTDPLRPDRIRVWYDTKSRKVDRVPTVG